MLQCDTQHTHSQLTSQLILMHLLALLQTLSSRCPATRLVQFDYIHSRILALVLHLMVSSVDLASCMLATSFAIQEPHQLHTVQVRK
jgi:hypothetical protein